MLFAFFILVVSVYVMKKCSSSFDIAANFLTRGIGEGIKGPTINAIASSLPELLISSLFLFYYKDLNGFSAGYATIIGSSAFNIAIIPVIAFLYVFSYNREKIFNLNKVIIKQDTFFLLGAIIVLSFGFFIGISFYLGILLISFYTIYIFFVLKTRKKLEKTAFMLKFIKENNLKLNNNIVFGEHQFSFLSSIFNLKLFRLFFNGKVNSFTSIIVIAISVILIGSSCYLLVISTEKISHYLGINLFFGAFIIAAIASSIPDTIFSVQDAQKDKFADSFSNAYGSNIFDICIGIGLPILIYTSIYGSISMSIPIERLGWIGNYFLNGDLFVWSLLVLFLFTLIISAIYYFKSLNIKSSILIFLLYVLFLASLILY
tara:strand:+ start:1067 stop:2188 length:1122 start_codon:yes stop_codon:yes gene_type:complete